MKTTNAFTGDIVQITNDDHHWFACLIIVTEVRNWGIIGYITIPTNRDEPNGTAYIRLKNEDFQVVGNATLVLGTGEES
jgi:hypothetical protein